MFDFLNHFHKLSTRPIWSFVKVEQLKNCYDGPVCVRSGTLW